MIISKQMEDKHNINLFNDVYHNIATLSGKWSPLLLFNILLYWLGRIM